MAVSFNSIPSDIRVPLFYAEVDNSQANSAVGSLQRLIVGQVNDDAEADEIGKLTLVSSLSLAKSIGGVGSMLAEMYDTWRRSDPMGEVWCLPIKATGTQASGKLTIAGAATAGGQLNLYVAGQRVRATVASGATAAEAATALAAAINAAGLSVAAITEAGEVTLTCRWSGLSGNDIQLELNRQGRNGGEFTPAGLTVTVTPMAGGMGTPDVAQALAALGDEPFEFICAPWADAASLDAWQAFMDDSSGRWSWARQLYGHVYSAKRGTLGELVALGDSRNDPHVTVYGFERACPDPVWRQAAAYAARTAVFISADPARPTQTGELTGITPAPAGERFILTERQSLLSHGIATAYSTGGVQRIERGITTYRENALGQPDNSFLDSETLHQSAYVINNLKTRVTSKYGRHKLANDGTRFGAGQAIATPKVIRAELIAGYQALELLGIVENADAFAQYLVVERSSTDPNRLDVLYPPDLVNQLRVFALQYQFRLQYPV
ncbi:MULTISPECIES: phage tail sheath subtilisin-like domain-containing protein [Pseudomonas]|uniref:phage tail sheath subtilisin-like domain-containing protein n=1 Tax=Pseudomonas guariconensis TaxID=1288410 RepID=UPI00209718A4|nr:MULTISPECIES: phage tail sheath subtilisin-like domain-containing protein [Pseudomonas]MCO7594271.1 phage tail sheath subtilisin-like domain-containing protein [Pseudomonas guariconensis]MCU7220002.1 phage tail sheath subtilisin-like domain-containing protein [Pseudomonas brassicacearum]